MSRRGYFPIAAAVAGAALLCATQVAAHAKLVGSAPAANATVPAPKVITLTFNEKLVPAFAGFEVTGADGAAVAVKTAVAKDGKSITGAPKGALKPGAYKVTWHAASADGHRMTGTIGFKVR